MSHTAPDPPSSHHPSSDAQQKRLKLREAGQKKFLEWKATRRSNHHLPPSSSPAATPSKPLPMHGAAPPASANLTAAAASTSGHESSAPQRQEVSPSTSAQTHCRPRTPPQPLAMCAAAGPTAVADLGEALSSTVGTTRADSRDNPLVDMLLMQVESLMRDKAALQQHNAALRRENEQLTELVGYLSEQAEQEPAASPRLPEQQQGPAAAPWDDRLAAEPAESFGQVAHAHERRGGGAVGGIHAVAPETQGGGAGGLGFSRGPEDGCQKVLEDEYCLVDSIQG